MSIPEYIDYYDASSMNPDLLIKDIILNSSGTKLYATCSSKVLSINIATIDPTLTNNIKTIAGSFDTKGFQDGNGVNAIFNLPLGLIMDTSGNVFVSDTDNHNIRKIDISGNVTTFAGDVSGNTGVTDSSGTFARFNTPSYLAIDSSNNLYVSDKGNKKIRKITPSQHVTTYAGSGQTGSGTSDDDAQGTSAKFTSHIAGIICDPSGNIYICEASRIRKIDSSGTVSTYIDSSGTNAYYSNLTRDRFNNIYISDYGRSIILKIDSDASGSVLAGSYNNSLTPEDITDLSLDLYSDMDILAKFDRPRSILKDASGDFYLLDGSRVNAPGFNNPFTALRKLRSIRVAPTPILTIESSNINLIGFTVTWTGGTYSRSYAFTMNGLEHTPSSYDWHLKTATFTGLQSGSIYNLGIQGINTHGRSNFAYTSIETTQEYLVTTLNTVDWSYLYNITRDSSGNVYSYDDNTSKLLKITPQGNVSNFVNSNDSISSIIIDSSNNIFSTQGSAIYKTDTSGNQTIFAGNPNTSGFLDSSGTLARFLSPRAIAIDSSMNLYVYDNTKIRKITQSANVISIAGGATSGYDDGPGMTATFNYNVSDMACDSSGNIYVAQADRIRKINSSGNVTTLVSSNTYDYTLIRCNKNGSIFAVCYNNGYNFIMEISPTGVETLFSGLNTVKKSVDGISINARYSEITGFHIDTSGNMFLTDYSTSNDSDNNLLLNRTYIRQIEPIRRLPTALSGLTPSNYVSGGFSLTWADGKYSTNYIFKIDNVEIIPDNYNLSLKTATFSGLEPGSINVGIQGTNLYGSTDFIYTDVEIKPIQWRVSTMSLEPALYISIANDSSGNIYSSDNSGNIFKLRAEGEIITTFIDLPLVSSIVIDSFNNIFGTKNNNYAIYKLDPSDYSSIFAGTYDIAGTTDSLGTLARFGTQNAKITIDSLNNVYLLDSGNYRIRKIDPSGNVTTLAGSTVGDGTNGDDTSAKFTPSVSDIACDSSGNIYVAEGARIRKINSSGNVTTLVSSSTYLYKYLKCNKKGHIYAACRYNNLNGRDIIVKIVQESSLTETILSGSYTDTIDTSVDGMDILARYTEITGLSIDLNGNIFVLDKISNNRSYVRQLIPDANSPSPISISWIKRNTSDVEITWASDFAREYTIDISGYSYTKSIISISNVYKIASFAGLNINTGYNVIITATNNYNTVAKSIQFTYGLQYSIPYSGSYDVIPLTTTIPFYTRNISNIKQDSSGNHYVIEGYNKILQITPQGVVRTFSDLSTINEYDIVTLAIDSYNNVFCANETIIYKIDTTGKAAIFAGSRTPKYRDGLGQYARFKQISNLTIDSINNLYVSDENRIRKITPSGIVTTLAGSGNAGSGTEADNGQGTDASLINGSITYGLDRYIYMIERYIIDSSNSLCRIRKISLTGTVTTVMTTNVYEYLNITYSKDQSLYVLSKYFSGTNYISGYDGTAILKIALGTNTETVISGSYSDKIGESIDGMSKFARYSNIVGMTVDSSDNLIVLDNVDYGFSNYICIRKFTRITNSRYGASRPGITSITWKKRNTSDIEIAWSGDNYSSEYQVQVSQSGSQFISIDKIYKTAVFTGLINTLFTIQVTGINTFSTKTKSLLSYHYADKNYNVTSLTTGTPLSSVNQIAQDSSGNIYVNTNSVYNSIILKITPSGTVSTFATLTSGIRLTEYVMDSHNNLFATCVDKSVIYKIDSSGNRTIFAGTENITGYVDSLGTLARFSGIASITIDSINNLFVCDINNARIRKITPYGFVTTVAGSGVTGTGNGNATIAQFDIPLSITCDAYGNLYICESNQGSYDNYSQNSRIRKISAGINKTVTTLVSSDTYSCNRIVCTKHGDIYASCMKSEYRYNGNEYSDYIFINKIIPGGTPTQTLFSGSDVIEVDGPMNGTNPPVDGSIANARYTYITAMIIDNNGDILLASGSTLRQIVGTV